MNTDTMSDSTQTVGNNDEIVNALIATFNTVKTQNEGISTDLATNNATVNKGIAELSKQQSTLKTLLKEYAAASAKEVDDVLKRNEQYALNYRQLVELKEKVEQGVGSLLQAQKNSADVSVDTSGIETQLAALTTKISVFIEDQQPTPPFDFEDETEGLIGRTGDDEELLDNSLDLESKDAFEGIVSDHKKLIEDIQSVKGEILYKIDEQTSKLKERFDSLDASVGDATKKITDFTASLPDVISTTKTEVNEIKEQIGSALDQKLDTIETNACEKATSAATFDPNIIVNTISAELSKGLKQKSNNGNKSGSERYEALSTKLDNLSTKIGSVEQTVNDVRARTIADEEFKDAEDEFALKTIVAHEVGDVKKEIQKLSRLFNDFTSRPVPNAAPTAVNLDAIITNLQTELRRQMGVLETIVKNTTDPVVTDDSFTNRAWNLIGLGNAPVPMRQHTADLLSGLRSDVSKQQESLDEIATLVKDGAPVPSQVADSISKIRESADRQSTLLASIDAKLDSGIAETKSSVKQRINLLSSIDSKLKRVDLSETNGSPSVRRFNDNTALLTLRPISDTDSTLSAGVIRIANTSALSSAVPQSRENTYSDPIVRAKVPAPDVDWRDVGPSSAYKP